MGVGIAGVRQRTERKLPGRRHRHGRRGRAEGSLGGSVRCFQREARCGDRRCRQKGTSIHVSLHNTRSRSASPTKMTGLPRWRTRSRAGQGFTGLASMRRTPPHLPGSPQIPPCQRLLQFDYRSERPKGRLCIGVPLIGIRAARQVPAPGYDPSSTDRCSRLVWPEHVPMRPAGLDRRCRALNSGTSSPAHRRFAPTAPHRCRLRRTCSPSRYSGAPRPHWRSGCRPACRSP